MREASDNNVVYCVKPMLGVCWGSDYTAACLMHDRYTLHVQFVNTMKNYV